MPLLLMHLLAIDFLRRNKIGRIRSTITGCLLSKRGERGTKSELATSGLDGYTTPAARGGGGGATLQSGRQNQVGLQLGRVATSPVRLGGFSLLQSGGTKSAVAHKWAGPLHNPCRLGGPQRFKAGDKISSGPQVGTLATCMHFR